ncbi:MAG: hypothetical protein ACYC0T_21295 [Ramlibacter sp.]
MKPLILLAVAILAVAAIFVPSLFRDLGAKLHDALFGYMASRGLVLGINDLTALTPTLYSVAQEVSAEPFGVISAINANFDDKGVAKGDTVTVPVAPTRAAQDFTPAAQSTAGADANADGIKVQITKSRKVPWNLTGEQLRSLENGGTDQEWVRQLIAQGMRTLRNEAEQDCAVAIKVGASRAVGAAGTTPFAANLDPLVDVRKVLHDNGAPLADLQFVMDTAAGANLRKLGVIQNQYQAGSDAERRSGNLLRQFGFELRESAGISQHVKGTGAGYLVNNVAGYAVNERSIAVDMGTGTVLAGDVVTFAGDARNYVVNEALAAAVLKIGRPGLRAALADNAAVTVGNSYTPHLAFERSAVVGVMRPPIMPANPLHQIVLISDAKGMTYMLLQIAQYGMVTWELHLAWGFKVVQGEHVAIVMG